MKVSYASANEKKDEMISSQKKTIENYDEMQDEIKSAEKQKNEYIRLSSE